MKRSSDRILTTHAGSLPRPRRCSRRIATGGGTLQDEAAQRVPAVGRCGRRCRAGELRHRRRQRRRIRQAGDDEVDLRRLGHLSVFGRLSRLRDQRAADARSSAEDRSRREQRSARLRRASTRPTRRPAAPPARPRSWRFRLHRARSTYIGQAAARSATSPTSRRRSRAPTSRRRS